MTEEEQTKTEKMAIAAIRKYRAEHRNQDRHTRILGCIDAARKIWTAAYG